MLRSLLQIILVCLVFVSCKSSTSSDDTSLKARIPLQIGNQWTYSVSETNLRTGNVELDTVVFTVVSNTLVDNNIWFKVEADKNFHSICFEGFYSNQEDGIYYLGSFSSNENEQTLVSSLNPGTLPDISTQLLLKENSTELNPPFIHHPDERVPERLLKNETLIGSTIYSGSEIDPESNSYVHTYIKSYYQQTFINATYPLVPVEMEYKIIDNIGFKAYDQYYFTRSQDDENEVRLVPILFIRYDLESYKIDTEN